MGFTKEQVGLLEEQITPDVVSERRGAGNMTLSYVEGFYAINKANEIFGYDGWDYEIVDLRTDTYQVKEVIHARATAQVKVTVRVPSSTEGVINDLIEQSGEEASAEVIMAQLGSAGIPKQTVTRNDVGHGTSTAKGVVPDFEAAEKEAVTDALKRSLRSFGNQFGNSLYDKSFLKTLKGGSGGASPARASGTKSAPRPASDKQKGFVEKLLKDKGKNLTDFTDKSLNTLTSQDASRIIDALQK